MRRARWLVLFVALLGTVVSGADTTIFGPRLYIRFPGVPYTAHETFTADSASTGATLKIINGGVTDALITVNGAAVAKGSDFLRPVTTPKPAPSPTPEGGTLVPYIEKPLTLIAGTNQITVQLLSGGTNAYILLAIVHSTADTTPPTITATISPPPNANGWNNSNVTVTFNCSDTGSGIATCPAPVSVTTETAGQLVSGTATDKAGNSASASVTVRLDKTPPAVTADPEPPANANGWNNAPVTVTFSATDALSGLVPGSLTAPVVLSADGTNLSATGVAMDLAGNVGSATASGINLDQVLPIATASVNPPPNANGWNNTAVTVHFACTDDRSGVAACASDQTLSAEGANQAVGPDPTVQSVAYDRAGNRSLPPTAQVFIDKTPPAFSLNPPSGGTAVFTPQVALTGAVADALSGIAGVTCNGIPASVIGSQVLCNLTLTPGSNPVNAVATDLAGNTASASFTLTYTPVPKVTITSPSDNSYVNISPTTVSGTVDDPAATVTINSIPATVSNGQFTLALPLGEGPNVVTAVATNAAGAVGTANIGINLDTTPPHVTITSPADGFQTNDASVSIAGNVNDIVVGTVNDQQAQVTVNGVVAQVANRTFLAAGVPLTVGPNVIQVVARDRVGNAANTQVTIIRQALTQPQIQLISGNNQTGVIGGQVANPLTVALVDGAGNPVPNRNVIFKATQNDGQLSAGGAPAPTVIATTNAQGRATALWTLGHRAGAGGNVAEAYSVGFEGTAVFTATGVQSGGAKIVVDTGNDQLGPISEPLPKPFIAVVVDEGNNRVANVPVTFSVKEGGGTFGGQPDFTVTSDSDGRVSATLTLGLQEGNANNLVEASFPGNPGAPAAFTASGRAAGNPAATTIAGVVLDNSNAPIPGVTVRAVLTAAARSSVAAVQTAFAVQTNDQGQFTIPQAPVGIVKLLVDGSTAQLQGEFPSLEYDIVTVAGQLNTVGQPIYLLPLNTANQLCVTPTTGGGTLTIPEAPGFSLTFGPGQVTFPGGSKSGCVSVTVVNGDKVPMVPGFGQQPRFIVTIQPSGAVFNPPAPITLPNVDGLAPRAVTEMYSFDHDIGSFVAIGTGIVSDDGLVIRSAPGVGVLKAGWHCGGDPAANGTVADCPVCQSCQGNSCKPDNNNKPPEKCASCNNGSPVPPKTDAQCCATVSFAGGFVVCCNTQKLACAGSGFTGSSAGDLILKQCVIAHETEHFKHVDCPTGANECDTTRPPFKPGQDAGQGECDASKVEVTCLQAANCGGDATCQQTVNDRITQIKAYGNSNKAGCFP